MCISAQEEQQVFSHEYPILKSQDDVSSGIAKIRDNFFKGSLWKIFKILLFWEVQSVRVIQSVFSLGYGM